MLVEDARGGLLPEHKLAVIKELQGTHGVVGMVGELQKSGQLRGDVEAREMVRSGLSLILYPIVDAPVLEILLPEEGEHATLERRKKVILSVLLSGIGNRA